MKEYWDFIRVARAAKYRYQTFIAIGQKKWNYENKMSFLFNLNIARSKRILMQKPNA